MTAVLLKGDFGDVAERTRVEVRVHLLFHWLVAPITLVASQEVAGDPTLWRLDRLVFLRKRPLPHCPEDARENAASVAVGKAYRAGDALFRCSFPARG